MRVLLPLLPMLWLTACAPTLPDPVVTSISPDRGWTGEDTVVTIAGANFLPQVEIAADRKDSADLDRTYLAWLEGPGSETSRVALSGVSLQDFETLQGVVGAGLPVGEYDLIIEGPTGLQAELVEAFTVSDTRADRLEVQIDTIEQVVNSYAWIQVTLVDPNGERVLSGFEVDVAVEASNSDIPSVTFAAGSLENQVIGEDGASLTGSLSSGGSALIGLTSLVPDTVTVRVSASNSRSGVAPAELRLLFRPGDERFLDIQLPASPFAVQAGEPFLVDLRVVDEFGNLVPEANEQVLLQDTCGSLSELVDVPSSATVPVVVTAATGPSTGCTDNRLYSVVGPSGQSEAFTVAAAEASSFQVQLTPATVTAGEDLFVLATPRDAYGNATSWTGVLDVTDTAGSLGAVGCQGTSLFLCRGTATVATDGATVEVRGDDGTVGTSTTLFEVIAALPPTQLQVTTPSTVAAGDGVDVEVMATDSFGNAIESTRLAEGDLSLTDELGEAQCLPAGQNLSGNQVFECVFETARSAARLHAALASEGLAAQSGDFEVENGPLGVVVVTPARTLVTAGELVLFSVEGLDAYGNPYVVQADPVVSLSASLGGWSDTVVLDSTGNASGQALLTVAGATRIDASQQARALGSSVPIVVQSGPAASVDVQVLEPWSFTGRAAEVQLTLVDGFGNRVDSGAAFTLSSTGGNGPQQAGALEQGRALVAFAWDSPTSSDTLEAVVGTETGASDARLVVQDCGAAGPTLDVEFLGLPFGLVCADPVSREASLVADFSGSSRGGAPLEGYRVAVDGVPLGGADPQVPLELIGLGGFELPTLLYQSDLCGFESTSVAWVGLDDGTATGPVSLAPALAQVPIGSSPIDLEIRGVTDCAGDPAVDAELWLRTDRGVLRDVLASGEGLTAVLDGAGSAQLRLDPSALAQGGLATVTAVSPFGTAGGQTVIDLTGDNQAPHVLGMSPSGDTAGPVGSIEVFLTEAALPSSVDTSTVSLSDGAPVPLSGVEALGESLVLTPATPLDATGQVFTVTVSSDVRDLAGNRLDGAWTGQPSGYQGVFGDLPGDGGVLDCDLDDTPRFRPDGDPGVGEERDQVVVDLSRTVAPTWWSLEVYDADGVRVRGLWEVPAGATDQVTWDGRDDSGKVAENGEYLVIVRGEDGLGNWDAGCEQTVTIDNRLTP